MQYTLQIETIENGYLVTAYKYNPAYSTDYDPDTGYVPPNKRYVQSLEDIAPIFADLIG